MRVVDVVNVCSTFSCFFETLLQGKQKTSRTIIIGPGLFLRSIKMRDSEVIMNLSTS